MSRPKRSPFLHEPPTTSTGDLAIVRVSRDLFVPVKLREFSGAVDGYAEGAVLNTRFGSFPHSTLLGIPWGSQVRASAVDTGTRGRKRKRDVCGAPRGEEEEEEEEEDDDDEEEEDEEEEEEEEEDDDDDDDDDVGLPLPSPPRTGRAAPETATAASGFVHILRPSPELWTMSLPHRTQVVYTPDYSIVLQRLRAFPGTQLIEAGTGSGSFTHAAARAVFGSSEGHDADRRGKVWSFEFNEDRFGKFREELEEHGLEGAVHVTHRDVYGDGFLVDGKSPRATAIFLDLPAPWRALPHLSRRRPPTAVPGRDSPCPSPPPSSRSDDLSDANPGADAVEGSREQRRQRPESEWISPLDPNRAAYICTFSPCIEQVTRTIGALRELGWLDVEMVEIAQRKYVVSRERISLDPTEPRDVADAVRRLKDIGRRTEIFNVSKQRRRKQRGNGNAKEGGEDDGDVWMNDAAGGAGNDGCSDSSASAEHPWKSGRILTRPEPEAKTHTSYLVFAVLPREWSEEDEEQALHEWGHGIPGGRLVGHAADRATRKKMKAEMLMPRKLRRELAAQAAEQQQQQQQQRQRQQRDLIDSEKA